MSFWNTIGWIVNPIGSAIRALSGGSSVGYSNSYNGQQIASLGSAADNAAGTGFDPNGIVGGFYNDLMGFTSQARDQAFQEYMQEKQWDYDRPSAQMARMADAGINLNLAAQGVADGNQSASAPSAAGASPVGNPLGIADSVTSGKLRVAEAANQKAQANLANKNAEQVDKLADSLVLERSGSFAKLLTEAGASEIAATAMALSLFSGGLGSVLALFKGDDICRRINLQNQLLDQEYNQGVERFEHERSMWPHLESIADSEAREAKWNADLAEFKRNIEKKRADLYSKYEGLPEWDIWQQQLYFLQNYGEDSPQYKSLFQIKEEFAYSEEMGRSRVELEHLYNKKYQELKALAEWQPYLDMLEEKKHQVMAILDLFYGQDSSFVNSLIKRLLTRAENHERPAVLPGSDFIDHKNPPRENGNNFIYK